MHYILYLCTKIIQELFCFKYFKILMISCFQLKPCVKMSFKLVLKCFNLKKLVVEPKNSSIGWTGWGTGRPQVQPVEVRVNPQLNRSRSGSTHSSTGRGPSRPPTQLIDGAKNFLFLSERLFNLSRLNLNRLRSGWDPTVTCRSLNAND